MTTAERVARDWSTTICRGRDGPCDAAAALAFCEAADKVDPLKQMEILHGARRLATPEEPEETIANVLRRPNGNDVYRAHVRVTAHG